MHARMVPRRHQTSAERHHRGRRKGARQGARLAQYREERFVNPEWRWWAAKLAGKLAPGATVDTPQAGFYRKTSKEHYGARKTFTPVAYWPGIDEDGMPALHCRGGAVALYEVGAMELWNYANEHPVTEEAYRDVAQ